MCISWKIKCLTPVKYLLLSAVRKLAVSVIGSSHTIIHYEFPRNINIEYIYIYIYIYLISETFTAANWTLFLSKQHTPKIRGVWKCTSSHSSPRHEMEVLGVVSGGRVPCNWVQLRTNLDVLEKRKIFLLSGM